MDYIKADEVFPKELFLKIQEYAEGKLIYIPKKKESRAQWGSKNKTRKKIDRRNYNIYLDYKNGENVDALAEKYYLSAKSIWRIIRQERSK
ncbi:CD3324 family protein [Facklamia sp. P13069]|uniref:CD3324 family protein n=1 Tax=Facklamia sp. P13069 TaxID=3421954 RepID=UPI003D170AD4